MNWKTFWRKLSSERSKRPTKIKNTWLPGDHGVLRLLAGTLSLPRSNQQKLNKNAAKDVSSDKARQKLEPKSRKIFFICEKIPTLISLFSESVQSPASADADNFIFARSANKHELVGGRTKCQNSESVKSFKTRRIADPVTGLPVTNRAECWMNERFET